jgi:hypothetical protein
MRFEPKAPASERAKTVHALDRSAIVTGCKYTRHTRVQLINKSV